MIPEDNKNLQNAVFRNTATDSAWLGYWLARHQQTENLAPPQLAKRLGISMDNLVLLCLCRTPTANQFREDLQVVCQRIGAKEPVLAHILRQEQNLEHWKGAGSPSTGSWLMAASDRPAEQQETPPPEAPHD